MRRISRIIIHCTATPEGSNYTIEEIRQWHLARGFSDIGYHFVIDLDGKVLTGRPIEISGAHTMGANYDSIGIAYVGGMTSDMKRPKDTRTAAQKNAMARLLMDLAVQYPTVENYGHRDFDKNKACPSFDARKEYKPI
jgi:N-acetylmuramoyl-L-alanine amidase